MNLKSVEVSEQCCQKAEVAEICREFSKEQQF